MSTINGTEFSDTTLVGSAGDDTILGLGGDDRITTGTGHDMINAGAGNDTLVVDYSASTTPVAMSSLIDTGIVQAGTGFPAPGGADFSGDFNSSTLTYTATYSGIDPTQADKLWLGIGSPALTLDNLSNSDQTATFSGSYVYDAGQLSTTVNYTVAATVSVGTWQHAADIGSTGENAIVHETTTDGFTINYVVDADVPDALKSVASLIVGSIADSFTDVLRGIFLYDDDGTSGQIADGNGNAATFDDIENFVITVGSAGSDLTTGDGDDTLTGGLGADVFHSGGGLDGLKGKGGDDTLVGGTGADFLDGGAGDDTAIYSGRGHSVTVTLNKSRDVIVEIDGKSEDTIRNVENIVAGSGADALTGDARANRLTGSGGNDVLTGGKGEDVLIGGAGKDTLSGGAGSDLFVFTITNDSAGGHRDTIEDFSTAQKDMLDLSAIDAKQASEADNAFHFLTGEGAAFKHAGDLHWLYRGSGAHQTTWVEGDTDGDRKADFTIVLDGHVALSAASFDL